MQEKLRLKATGHRLQQKECKRNITTEARKPEGYTEKTFLGGKQRQLQKQKKTRRQDGEFSDEQK
jgi:hypothetical protein